MSEWLTYACDTVEYNRIGNKDAWIPEDKVNGQMFKGYPCVEFIPGTQGAKEPLRRGPFVIDIDSQGQAVVDAIRIVDWFDEVYSLPPDAWRVYLSGKKGVHLELSEKTIGTENGHVWLSLGYKRLAKDIEGELGIKLDTSMYNRGTGKPFRQPNVMRPDTGTCKRQITYNDLYEITSDEDYVAACREIGPTWEPEDTQRNETLADKVAHYLSDATKAQEQLATVRPLSDDEIDRLAINIPPCISALANTTQPGKTGATFNDVAIQLTAYAITSGRTEEDFLAGCHPFIANYPSTSLTSWGKRLQNCRERFRNMAVNGYHHSCGGVLALGFGGWDCKECTAHDMSRALGVEVVEAQDISEVDDYSLQIPPSIVDQSGPLIQKGIDGLIAAGSPRIMQYLLPTVLAHVGAAIGGKIRVGREWSNLYEIKIGGTSTGKSYSTDTLEHVISQNPRLHGALYGTTDFASGAALLRSLVEKPQCLVLQDEITYLLSRPATQKDMIIEGKIDALLQLYTRAGGIVTKCYGNSKDSFRVEKPVLNLLGNATPLIYDALRSEDFNSGLLQRVNFWAYSGPAPYHETATSNAGLESFCDDLMAIIDAPAPGGNLAMMSITDIDTTPLATKMLTEFSRQLTDETNAMENEGERGMVKSKWRLAIKYAMRHHVSLHGGADGLFSPLSAESLEWGREVTSMLVGWKIEVLNSRVTSGKFDRDCRLFKDAIMAAIKTGHRPTFNMLRNRRREMNDWLPKYSDEVIKVLVKRKEIVVDESQKITAYQLVKRKK